jgi:hypothetical protein
MRQSVDLNLLLFHTEKFDNQRTAYYLCESKHVEIMDISKSSGLIYLSPAIRIIEVDTEGVLCASGDGQTETLGENLGSWG